MEDHSISNGHSIKNKLHNIESSVYDLRNDLVEAINRLTSSIEMLTIELKTMQQSVPLKVVAWMFLVLILSLVGVQGAEWLFKVYLAKGGI